jgi:hypothetical protein
MVSLLSMFQTIIVPKKYFSEGVTPGLFAETEAVRIEGNGFVRERKIGNYCKRKEFLTKIKHLFC